MKKIFSKIDFSYFYSFLGEATLGLTLILYIVIGRFIGTEQYGVFEAANSLAGILTFFIGFGFAGLLAREVAANPEKGAKSTTAFLLIEAANSLLVLLLLLPIVKAMNFEGSGIIICYLTVFAGGCRCTKQTLRSVFRGLGQFKSETIAVAIERVSLFALASATLFLTSSLVWVVGIIAVVRLLDTLILFYYLNRQVSLTESIDFSGLKEAFKRAYPFALSGVLWVLYYQVDALMLKSLSSSTETGYYGAAYRLLEIFSALPRVIFYVSFTKLTRCYATDPKQLPAQIKQTTLLLLATVLPCVTLAGFGQAFLINVTYGRDYLPALAALSILLPSLSLKMFASLSSNVFQAVNRENILPPVLLATVCINVVSNAVLIPRYGAVGAAIATLLSELIFSVTGLLLMVRIGYQKVGQTLLSAALLSLLVASIPSFLLAGLSPVIAVVLMISGLTAITALMRPQQANNTP